MALRAMVEKATAVENLILNVEVQGDTEDEMRGLNEKLMGMIMKGQMEWNPGRLYIWSVVSEHIHIQLLQESIQNFQSHVVLGNLLAERMINIQLFNQME